MALIRCTCVYRMSTRSELDDGGAAIIAKLRDPWCPADYLHSRVAERDSGPVRGPVQR